MQWTTVYYCGCWILKKNFWDDTFLRFWFWEIINEEIQKHFLLSSTSSCLQSLPVTLKITNHLIDTFNTQIWLCSEQPVCLWANETITSPSNSTENRFESLLPAYSPSLAGVDNIIIPSKKLEADISPSCSRLIRSISKAPKRWDHDPLFTLQHKWLLITTEAVDFSKPRGHLWLKGLYLSLLFPVVL